MKTLLFGLFLLAIFSVCSKASADILFFDVNNSPEEIRTAERAAAIRNEKLVVFPPRTPAQQQILVQYDEFEKQKLRVDAPRIEAYRRMDQARAQRAQEAAKPNPNAARLAQLDRVMNENAVKMNQTNQNAVAQLAAISAKQAALHNTVTIGPAQLRNLDALIASYNVPGKEITSVVFSGHHDFHSYIGVLGTIEKDQVARIFNKYPEAKSSVKSVYGWGCYSGTVAEKDWWLRTFPSVQVVGGFDAGAPGKDRPASLGYLRDSLVKEAELRRLATDRRTMYDVNRIRRFVTSYNGFTMTNAAICTRGVYVGRNTGSFDLSRPNNLCSQDVLSEIVNYTTKFNALLNGQGDIPCDGSNSWIRKYYNSVRTHQHCGSDLGPLQAQFSTYTNGADKIIRLIDFKEVMEHFNAYYGGDIAKIRAEQARCGIRVPNLGAELKCEAPPAQNPNSPKVTRQELMTFTASINSSPCVRKRPITAQNDPFVKMNIRGINIIRQLNCIPLSWVAEYEPGTPVETPVCRSQ